MFQKIALWFRITAIKIDIYGLEEVMRFPLSREERTSAVMRHASLVMRLVALRQKQRRLTRGNGIRAIA